MIRSKSFDGAFDERLIFFVKWDKLVAPNLLHFFFPFVKLWNEFHVCCALSLFLSLSHSRSLSQVCVLKLRHLICLQSEVTDSWCKACTCKVVVAHRCGKSLAADAPRESPHSSACVRARAPSPSWPWRGWQLWCVHGRYSASVLWEKSSDRWVHRNTAILLLLKETDGWDNKERERKKEGKKD